MTKVVKKVAIYTRVSSKKQEVEGVSIEAQVTTCKKFAETNGWVVVEVVRETMSGRTDKRPKFRRICAEAINGKYDIILVHKFDRFARNRILAATKKALLREKGIEIISVAENFDFDPNDPSTFLMEGILELFAEWYAINLAQETLKGQLYQIGQGRWPSGAVPLGYAKKDGEVVPHQPCFDQMRWAFKEFSTGEYSLKKWADYAHEKGIVAKNGNRLWPTSWQRMFRNPFYFGKLVWAGVEEKGKHEAVVSQKVFEEVQAILSKNRSGTQKKKQYFLLSGGYVFSESANSVMYGGVNGGYRYYQSYGLCPDGKMHYIPAEKLERWFVDLLEFIQIKNKEFDNDIVKDPSLLMALKVAKSLADVWSWLDRDQQKLLVSIVFHKHGIRVKGMNINSIDLGLTSNFKLCI